MLSKHWFVMELQEMNCKRFANKGNIFWVEVGCSKTIGLGLYVQKLSSCKLSKYFTAPNYEIVFKRLSA